MRRPVKFERENRVRLSADRVITWAQPDCPVGIAPEHVYFGPDPFGLGGLQVAVAASDVVPSRQSLRDLLALRRGRAQVQVVIAVQHDDAVYLLGPDPQSAPVALPAERAQRQLQSLLDEPDVLSAVERLAGFRKTADSATMGFANNGLFASHHVAKNVPARSDWDAMCARGRDLLALRGAHLVAALGFASERGPNGTLTLSVADDPRAVAVFLDETETFDNKSSRFQLSPVAFGLAVAARRALPWLIVLRKDQIRLYPGRDGVGVGSKGQAETYFEVDLATVDSHYAGLLPLIFSADALAAGSTTDQLLQESARFATDLGARLRERIYEDIVPPVAVEVANQLAQNASITLDAEGLATGYRVTLRILFRLLFQAYAEDRGLLPSGRNEAFDSNSLKTNARRLLGSPSSQFGDASTIWLDLVQVWNAIDQGNPHWQVPAYNGGLFSTDPARSLEGALIAKIQLPDRVLGPALQSLLIDVGADGVPGPVDFRSLSVREFGTIYEGLLESSLSLAESDLTFDSSGAWVPAAAGETVHAAAGTVYFHTASGERKATGSYFTPKVIVDHLIERSIVPALTSHLDRIGAMLVAGDAVGAARDFFDFRVADLAMGSGHFLVAAVDKVEALMRSFLTEHSVPGVNEELMRLADIARDALGTDDVAKSEVEPVGLLRRQVARRCIYGLDINAMAVELARLALWIHTFVPGLPMSNLDHGLVNANSLTGIGTIDEALDALQPGRRPGDVSLFDSVIVNNLVSARTLLTDVANASEANKAEVEEGARLLAKAKESASSAKKIFDTGVAARLGLVSPELAFTEDELLELAGSPGVAEIAESLQPAHLPFLFPEVFLRNNGGFDVILGNPPWEKVKVETDQWWGIRLPGLRSLPQAKKNAALADFQASRPDLVAEFTAEQERVAAFNRVLKSGPFDMGAGDTDVYQAFAWRNWQLIRQGGRSAIVLPRSALSGSGLSAWRQAILADGSFADVSFIENAARWAFDMEPRYTIGLVVIAKNEDRNVHWVGPFQSEHELIRGASSLAVVDSKTFAEWSSSAAFPLIPDNDAAAILRQMKLHPRFSEDVAGFRYRVVRELDTAMNKKLYNFDLDAGEGAPVATGASFNYWSPDFGRPYAYADRAAVEELLEARLVRQFRLKSSAFYGLSSSDLDPRPWRAPRIAFRDVARATDTRTAIVCLLPAGTFLVEKAPYLYRLEGSAATDAYLLGIMSSLVFDWYARRWVELKLSIELLRDFPIPLFIEGGAHAQRVVEIAGRLAAVDSRFEEWAAEIPVPVGSVVEPTERADLTAELDAVVAHLYGLNEAQIAHIHFTFHRGWNYVGRLELVLKHFRQWR